MGISINDIKKYNSQLEEYKEKAKSLDIEKKMAEREIQRLCTELTNELGTEVTADNAEALYRKYMQKVQNTLNTGNEIFDRITAEEKLAQSAASV